MIAAACVNLRLEPTDEPARRAAITQASGLDWADLVDDGAVQPRRADGPRPASHALSDADAMSDRITAAIAPRMGVDPNLATAFPSGRRRLTPSRTTSPTGRQIVRRVAPPPSRLAPRDE
jgi:hypothetical protein